MSIGIHLHGQTIPNEEGFRSIPWTWVLYLTSNNWWENDLRALYPTVKSWFPDHIPIVRFFHPDVMSMSPEEAADQFCGLLTEVFGDAGVHAIPANELDLALEHGGHVDTEVIPGKFVTWDSQMGLEVIAAWLSANADAHRRIRPQDTLHLPACSVGKPVATWYDAMRAGGAAQKFDVLDVHLYGSHQLSRLWDTQARGNTFGSEVGVQNGNLEEITYLIKALRGTDFAWWKWSEPPRAAGEGNPEGDPAGYAIAGRQDVIEVLAKTGEEITDGETIDMALGADDVGQPVESGEIPSANPGDPPADAGQPQDNQNPEGGAGSDTPGSGGGMNQQGYLAIVSDIWATAEKLSRPVGRMTYSERAFLARRIIDQCEILDDLKIQEVGEAPEPFQPTLIKRWVDNHDGVRPRTDLIIIHSTRSGKERTPVEELRSTLNWFANHESDASAQAVVAANGAIYFCVSAEMISWGAEYLNQRAINLELVQAKIDIPFTDAQYASLAWLLKEWTGMFGVPYLRIMDEDERGIIGHEDTAQGKFWVKSDPGYLFDWARIGL